MDFLLGKWKSAPGRAREGDGQVRIDGLLNLFK